MGRNIFTTPAQNSKNSQFLSVNVFLTSNTTFTKANKREKLSNFPINIIKEMDQFI